MRARLHALLLPTPLKRHQKNRKPHVMSPHCDVVGKLRGVDHFHLECLRHGEQAAPIVKTIDSR